MREVRTPIGDVFREPPNLGKRGMDYYSNYRGFSYTTPVIARKVEQVHGLPTRVCLPEHEGLDAKLLGYHQICSAMGAFGTPTPFSHPEELIRAKHNSSLIDMGNRILGLSYAWNNLQYDGDVRAGGEVALRALWKEFGCEKICPDEPLSTDVHMRHELRQICDALRVIGYSAPNEVDRGLIQGYMYGLKRLYDGVQFRYPTASTRNGYEDETGDRECGLSALEIEKLFGLREMPRKALDSRRQSFTDGLFLAQEAVYMTLGESDKMPTYPVSTPIWGGPSSFGRAKAKRW